MSFNIATTGLNAITQQLGAISNNIANSGTVGYKSMRTEFAALYAGSAPLGVGVDKTSQSIGVGGNISATGRDLDLAINGSGFFMVRDTSGATSFTRAGYFGTDSSGWLVNNQGGHLQGYPVDGNGRLQVGTLADLQINASGQPASATKALAFTANFDAQAEILPETPVFNPKDDQTFNNTYTTQVYDSQGMEHSLSQYFIKTGENQWQVHYLVDGSDAGSAEMTFDKQGRLITPIDTVNIHAALSGVEDLDIELDYIGSRQSGSAFNVSKNNADGYPAGERIGQQIDDDGSVYATFSNGQRTLQGQLVLASFTNQDGLQAINGTAWQQTSSSGAPLVGAPKSGLFGQIASAALESSNVDLTGELVGLMSAQRNYQANTKVISTNDQMMNALFQAL